MPDNSFWVTRFSVLGLSALLSLSSILLIANDRLLESLPMKYILAIAVCQLGMAGAAIAFGGCSLIYDIAGRLDPVMHVLPSDDTAAIWLANIEAVLFKASELVQKC